MKQVLAITRKELNSYFSSPTALMAVGIFLVSALVFFFRVDGFFGRGLADLRPLFRWLPLLMIVLVAPLTMRQWSEEQQSGTLEVLATLPLRLWQLVLGKFLAVLGLVGVALVLTLFLPATITSYGNLDWGPIVGGYVAALLLACAYIAIGLFVSSLTRSQFVALMATILICAPLHLLGERWVAEALGGGGQLSEILRALSTKGRFESIERGVIDLRDLLYYAALTGLFLALNIFALDRRRWGVGDFARNYRFNAQTGMALLAANLIVLNFILYPLRWARLDLTADREYSLSAVTRDTLDSLQEPLLIRAYISDENHPLLEPLIPRLRDTLTEYELSADGSLDLEILDPIDDPEKEAEANQTYGVRPSPLQVNSASGVSVLNIYFDILFRYGDQTAVLNFSDLIEVDQFADGSIEVNFRNLEYDLTRTIRRVVSGFQSLDAIFASYSQPATLTLYYTPANLPTSLAEAPTTIESVVKDIQAQAGDKLSYKVVNVDEPNDTIDGAFLFETYGIRGLAESLLNPQPYYLHMVLEAEGKIQVIYPPLEVSQGEIRRNLEAAFSRSATGFLKTVGAWTPPQVPTPDMFGQQRPPLQTFNQILDSLREEYEVSSVDLTTGQAPNTDVLLVIAPQALSEQERFAIDQYLMRGGTLIVATGSYQLFADPVSGLGVTPITGGLNDLLAHYGVAMPTQLLMDAQNGVFPTQVQRNVGGVIIQDIIAQPYPFFVDIRRDGMAEDSPILAGLQSVTLAWASPLDPQSAKDAGRQVSILLQSSPASWTVTDTNIQPNLELFPETGFPFGNDRQRYPLALIVQGNFTSFYADKEVPAAPSVSDPNNPQAEPAQGPPLSALPDSPDSARLLVLGSSEFLNDNVLGLAQSVGTDTATNSLTLLQNAIDWATEDTALLSIRARGTQTRLLDPLAEEEQNTWEVVNYVFAVLSVAVLGIVWQVRRRSEPPMPLVLSDGTVIEEAAPLDYDSADTPAEPEEAAPSKLASKAKK